MTAELCLEAHGSFPGYHHDFRLNERHYGALEGMRKDDIEALTSPIPHSTRTVALTVEELERVRRSMRERPPAMTPSHTHYPHYDPSAPKCESLADCQARVLECYSA